jgi:uncharacterized protein YaeQ
VRREPVAREEDGRDEPDAPEHGNRERRRRRAGGARKQRRERPAPPRHAARASFDRVCRAALGPHSHRLLQRGTTCLSICTFRLRHRLSLSSSTLPPSPPGCYTPRPRSQGAPPAMALTATMYHLHVALSDVDRGVYEALDLRLARHPSESERYLLTRLLAYCLSYEEGIAFSKGGLSSASDAPITVTDPTGALLAWIDIGSPSAERLHKASKLAPRVSLFTAADLPSLRREAASRPIHRLADIDVWQLAPLVFGRPRRARGSQHEAGDRAQRRPPLRHHRRRGPRGRAPPLKTATLTSGPRVTRACPPPQPPRSPPPATSSRGRSPAFRSCRPRTRDAPPLEPVAAAVARGRVTHRLSNRSPLLSPEDA